MIKYKKNITKYTLSLVIALAVVIALPFIGGHFVHSTSIPKSSTYAEDSSLPTAIKATSNGYPREFVSNIVEAEFEFNALAPHWKQLNSENANTEIEVRVSKDKKTWSEWLAIETIETARDDDTSSDGFVFAETPLIIEGRYFQYKATIAAENPEQALPEIIDLQINYIDSRLSWFERIQKSISKFGAKIFASNSGPQIISRAQWGNPDPYGDRFKGTDKYWRPSYAPVEQVFLHHTVSPSIQSNPEEVLRAIYDYHANTLGWGDIGYNYIVDSSGRIYEGRFGGDNVVAGHTYHYNTGSLGVAVLGCFEPSSATCNQLNNGNTRAPSDTVIDSLTDLLSWKTTNYEINPTARQTFCNFKNEDCLRLWTISAHRDASNTSCNGGLFYDQLPSIRSTVSSKNNAGWNYSATQQSFQRVRLDPANDSTDVTLSFKNTGLQTWSNSTNRILLRTANPNARSSEFRGSGWIDKTTVTSLNEATVAPGETGTFTFNISNLSNLRGRFTEGFRLVSENNSDFANYFGLVIDSSTVHPDGSLIQKRGQAAVYLIEDGQRRKVAHKEALTSHSYGANDILASTRLDDDLPLGVNLTFREGTLIKGSGPSVYVVDDNAGETYKRRITSRATFQQLGYKYSEVLNVKENQLPPLDGDLVTDSSIHPDGTLISSPNDKKVYLLTDGEKLPVTSRPAFESHGFSFENVKSATSPDLALPTGNVLSFREGTLIRGSGQEIYVVNIESGTTEKRKISSRSVFDLLGYELNKVRKVLNAQLPNQDGSAIE